VTTTFVYDGFNTVQEQSATLGNANLLNGGLDEVFARNDSGGTWSVLRDGLRGSLSLTDPSGAAQTDYTYGAFGQSTNSGASSTNSNQYTGRENDSTGLQFNRARYYSSKLQRFISEDPWDFGGGDLNLYAYVRNDPQDYIDPFGRDLWGLTGGLAVFGGSPEGAGGEVSGIAGMNTRDGSGGTALSYGYFMTNTSHDGLAVGAAAGGGGGIFWSNAKDFNDLAGRFKTTVISIGPIGIQIDRGSNAGGDSITNVSVTYGKGWGGGIAHFDTYTPPWSIKKKPYSPMDWKTLPPELDPYLNPRPEFRSFFKMIFGGRKT